MNTRVVLIRMLKQLLEDMLMLHQQGAGYYSCVPIISRYNKLLSQTTHHFPEAEDMLSTFDPLDAKDPKDPSEKMTVIQGIRVEIGQLLALLESLEDAAETPA